MVRAAFVTQSDVDSILDRAGAPQFVAYGIVELDADEVVRRTGGSFRITPDPNWPPDAHVLFIRSSGGKSLRATHPEVKELTEVANSVPLVRAPKA